MGLLHAHQPRFTGTGGAPLHIFIRIEAQLFDHDPPDQLRAAAESGHANGPAL